MKLRLDTAISLILAIPAHRSSNDGHRNLGNKSLDLLFEYSKENEDKEFNMAVIASVLSAVRAFSVERDKLNGRWKVLDGKKSRVEELISKLNNLSLLNKNSYFTQILSLLPSLEAILDSIVNSNKLNYWQFLCITLVTPIVLEVIIQILLCILKNINDKKGNEDKIKVWREDNLKEYKKIVKCFISNYIEIHKIFYPNENKIDSYIIDTKDQIETLKQQLIDIHFCLN